MEIHCKNQFYKQKKHKIFISLLCIHLIINSNNKVNSNNIVIIKVQHNLRVVALKLRISSGLWISVVF